MIIFALIVPFINTASENNNNGVETEAEDVQMMVVVAAVVVIEDVVLTRLEIKRKTGQEIEQTDSLLTLNLTSRLDVVRKPLGFYEWRHWLQATDVTGCKIKS